MVSLPAILGDADPIEELEISLRNHALNFLELERICEEIDIKVEETPMAKRALDLADRLEAIRISLSDIERRLEDLEGSTVPERAADLKSSLGILRAESDDLSERVSSYDGGSILGSDSPGKSTDRIPELIEDGAGQLIHLVQAVSDKLKTSLFAVSSTMGGILGSAARIDAGTVKTDGFTPTTMVILTLGLTMVLGGASYLMQNYWTGGFSSEGMLRLMGSRLGLSRDETLEEASSTLAKPFWDPVGKTDVDDSGNISEVDQQYIRMLFDLGYVQEARSVIDYLEESQNWDGRRTSGSRETLWRNERPPIGLLEDSDGFLVQIAGRFVRNTANAADLAHRHAKSLARAADNVLRKREG